MGGLVLEAGGGDGVECVLRLASLSAGCRDEFEGRAGEHGDVLDVGGPADCELAGAVTFEGETEEGGDGSFGVHGGEERAVGDLVGGGIRAVAVAGECSRVCGEGEAEDAARYSVSGPLALFDHGDLLVVDRYAGECHLFLSEDAVQELSVRVGDLEVLVGDGGEGVGSGVWSSEFAGALGTFGAGEVVLHKPCVRAAGVDDNGEGFLSKFDLCCVHQT